ncbi:hypothetical protein H9N25_19950 [Pedobacter riviphilus]|uniref:Lipoprotein n=1 Tax=Pedobacter riviphilus TaxID=2766984 RepID=A0ABX6TID1_9SPHI|nr:hypothetical protein [Pedobacter riviphilus]QNR84155.1 hypothetical protein H9N25_19950 [Pedobacter riviphilus]
MKSCWQLLRKGCFVIFTIISLISCQQTNSPKPQYSYDNGPEIDTSYIAIIPFKKNAAFRKSAQLTSTDLKEIDKILLKFAEDYNKHILSLLSPNDDKKNFLINLKDYKRQYTPTTNSKGEKEVVIYCMCHTFNVDWKKERIDVEDGGKCYFMLKVNLKTKDFESSVNGEA